MDSSDLLRMTRDNQLTDLGPFSQSESNFKRFVEVGRGMLSYAVDLGGIGKRNLPWCPIFQLSSSELDPMLARLPLSLRLLTTIGCVADPSWDVVFF